MVVKKKVNWFSVLSYVLLFLGIAFWIFLLVRIAREGDKIPLGGSSDMIRRITAINEAKEKGENTYQFETTEMPMPMGDTNNQENK